MVIALTSQQRDRVNVQRGVVVGLKKHFWNSNIWSGMQRRQFCRWKNCSRYSFHQTNYESYLFTQEGIPRWVAFDSEYQALPAVVRREWLVFSPFRSPRLLIRRQLVVSLAYNAKREAETVVLFPPPPTPYPQLQDLYKIYIRTFQSNISARHLLWEHHMLMQRALCPQIQFLTSP